MGKTIFEARDSAGTMLELEQLKSGAVMVTMVSGNKRGACLILDAEQAADMAVAASTAAFPFTHTERYQK